MQGETQIWFEGETMFHDVAKTEMEVLSDLEKILSFEQRYGNRNQEGCGHAEQKTTEQLSQIVLSPTAEKHKRSHRHHSSHHRHKSHR